MTDGIVQRIRVRCEGAQIPVSWRTEPWTHELDVITDRGETLEVSRVRQRVEDRDRHFWAMPTGPVDEVRADETGTTRDQDPHTDSLKGERSGRLARCWVTVCDKSGVSQ